MSLSKGNSRSLQVATEQDNMGTGTGLQVGLDDDDHIEGLGKLLVQQGGLVDTLLEAIFDTKALEMLLWQSLVVELVAILVTRATASIWAFLGQVQGGITTQLGDQMQLALISHLQGSIVPKIACPGSASTAVSTRLI